MEYCDCEYCECVVCANLEECRECGNCDSEHKHKVGCKDFEEKENK